MEMQDIKLQEQDIKSLIETFKLEGIKLFVDTGKLKYKASKSSLTKERLYILKVNKEAIIEYLVNNNNEITVIEDSESRYKPFPMTDVQSSYVLGRKKTFDYGGVACHVYLELKYSDLDIHKVNEVWNKIINRHDMLKSIMTEDGYQQVLENVPEFKVSYHDLRKETNALETLEEIRNDMGHRMYELGKFPMFDIGLSKIKDQDILHFSMEFLIADWKSIWMILSEFEAVYFNLNRDLPTTNLTFRDYLVAERKLKETDKYIEDKKYWLDKIEDFPLAPNIPKLNSSVKNNDSVGFKRHFLELSVEEWKKFKENAKNAGVTPTAAVLAAYGAVLGKWSQNKNFCINLTVLNRMPLHKDVNNIVGDFTSISLLNIDERNNDSFINKAKNVNTRLFEDLDHRLYSGVEVIREISRRKDREAAMMPIVFTSAIGLTNSNNNLIGKFNGAGITQTPQVFIDCQVMDGDFGMQLNWDVREGVFKEGVIEDMFASFEKLLKQLTETFEFSEKNSNIMLPKWQMDIRKKVNNTEAKLDTGMLYSKFINQLKDCPNKQAVVDGEGSYTYEELAYKANAVANEIEKHGGKIKDNIAIIMEKSRHQVAAVLGITYMGETYVPIDANHAEIRRNTIIKNAGIKIVLTTSDLSYKFDDDVTVINVDKLEDIKEQFAPKTTDDTIPAYIIYTSGTTGMPKGVVITHKAAVNTIEDINNRFNVKASDNVFGISQLHFDLSVYDIFGALSCGATLIYPSLKGYMDPSCWVELIKKYNITIWNSVPAFLKMLLSYVEDKEKSLPIRLVMLSGDWIPLDMPDKLLKICKDAKVFSLGGATEASIWSIHYEYKGLKSEWTSIPYGFPLSNQGFRILDDNLNDCPVWVAGELCIYGDGLALEYYRDKEMSDKKFINHPVDNQRLYRTGDMGRYLPEGEIEILGRIDQQVKLRGHRIELGEIEYAINQHPSIVQSVAFISENKNEIYAVAETRDTSLNSEELKRFVMPYLPKYMIPVYIMPINSLPLNSNGKIDRKAVTKLEIKRESALSTVNDNENEDLINSLTEIWKNVTQTESILPNQDFYELGADSLVLAQIATKIRDSITSDIAFDDFLRQMIYNPTINQLAEFISEKINNKNNNISINDKKKEEVEEKLTFVQEYGGNIEDGIRVIFHGSLGALNRFEYLAQKLVDQKKGKVIAIGISNINKYCSTNAEDVVATVADEYTKIIIENNPKKIQLIGYCFGGLISLEVANRLNEMGYEVADLSILDSLLLTKEFIVEDELLMEMMFLDTMSLSLLDIGVEKPEVYEKILVNEAINKRTIPKNFLASLQGEEDVNNLSEFFRNLSLKSQHERFEWYAEICEKKNGNKMNANILKRLYNVCLKTFEAMHYGLCPNFGNINYFFAKDTEGEFKRLQLENWQEVCLGQFSVYDIAGDHYSCVEKEDNAIKLAELIDSL